MTITLDSLIKALRPAMTETRATDREIIALAGAVGCIKADLSVHLRLAALHGAAKQAAVDLYDSGMAKSEAAHVRIMARLAQLEAELDEIRSELFAAALERTYGGMQ
jgi:hypothetical protein